jgi:hypothetical protein
MKRFNKQVSAVRCEHCLEDPFCAECIKKHVDAEHPNLVQDMDMDTDSPEILEKTPRADTAAAHSTMQS